MYNNLLVAPGFGVYAYRLFYFKLSYRNRWLLFMKLARVYDSIIVTIDNNFVLVSFTTLT